MKNKVIYRVWQFRQSFKPSLSQNEWDRIRLYLTPEQIVLLSNLPVSDQNHTNRVFTSLLDGGEKDQDLIKAALLHDIGKGLHPLRRWERVFAVFISGLSGALARDWGQGEPVGIKRSLVIIHQHSAWGAELALGAGCNEDVIWLIKNHENYQIPTSTSKKRLESLKKLQTADNQN